MLSSCKSSMQPDKPTAETRTFNYKKELSQINIPIEASILELQKKVNQQTGNLLYNDNSFTNNDNDGMKVKITKRGTIRLSSSSNVLHYSVPLSIKLTARKVVFCFEAIQSTDFDVDFKFKSEIDTDRKWNLVTKTECTSYKLITEPEISFGPVTLNLGSIVNFAIEESKELMADELDKQLKENFDARKYIQETWDEFQKPIHLSDEFHSWLLIEPEKMLMTKLKTSRRRLILNVGMEAYTHIVVSENEPDFKPNHILPDLIKTSVLPDGFLISLGSTISYEEATRILQKNIKGYVYEDGGRTIEITDISTYGNGDQLVMEIHFSGSFNGIMYMTGIPKYNNETQTVYIDDFDFDIKTKQALLKVGGWLLHGTFKKKIIQYSTISIAEEIEETRKLAQESLDENQMTDGIKLDCKINSIEPKGIYLNDKGIKTLIYIKGESKVKL